MIFLTGAMLLLPLSLSHSLTISCLSFIPTVHNQNWCCKHSMWPKPPKARFSLRVSCTVSCSPIGQLTATHKHGETDKHGRFTFSVMVLCATRMGAAEAQTSVCHYRQSALELPWLTSSGFTDRYGFYIAHLAIACYKPCTLLRSDTHE